MKVLSSYGQLDSSLRFYWSSSTVNVSKYTQEFWLLETWNYQMQQCGKTVWFIHRWQTLKRLAFGTKAIEVEYLLEEGHQTQKYYYHYPVKKSKSESSKERLAGVQRWKEHSKSTFFHRRKFRREIIIHIICPVTDWSGDMMGSESFLWRYRLQLSHFYDIYLLSHHKVRRRKMRRICFGLIKVEL